MRGVFVVTVWALLVGARLAAAADLVLTAQPGDIIQGLTPSLTINCSFSSQTDSTIDNLISIIISKADRQGNSSHSYLDLATANTFDPDKVQMVTPINAVGQAHLSPQGLSYLSLFWPYPSLDQAGDYRCEVQGIDQSGHSVTTARYVQVRGTNASAEIVDLLTSLNHTLTRVAALERKLAGLDLISATTFQVDSARDSYGDSDYLLSNIPAANDLQAALLCGLEGGYLVEIETDGELEFLRAFLNRTAAERVKLVLTGGNDWRREDRWVWRYNQQLVSLNRWSHNFPIPSSGYRCLLLNRDDNWLMQNGACSLEIAKGFVCEIPRS